MRDDGTLADMLSRKQFIARFLGGLAAGVKHVSPALARDATPATSPIVGIDHIPLAVKDLERAAETYRRLGFAIKPGRLHATDLSALQHALRSADVHHPVSLDTATYRSVFIAPQDTHGVWLEFRELR